MKNNRTEETLDRRTFLRRAGVGGLAVAGLALGLTACGGGQEAEPAAKSQAAAQPAAKPTDPCSDLSGLTQDEKNMRTTLQYKAVADDPAKPCHACNFWKAPEEGSPCGGCTLMKGPVHPDGGCISWVAVQKS